MTDIFPPADGSGRWSSIDTQVGRAANILSVQLGALEYAPDLGIDLAYFLSEDFKFQDASFKAYTIQRLADYSINVASVTEVVDNLFETLGYNLATEEIGGGLIAR